MLILGLFTGFPVGFVFCGFFKTRKEVRVDYFSELEDWE